MSFPGTGYQGFGGQAPPPRRRAAALWLLVGGAGLLVLLAATVVVLVLVTDDDRDNDPGPLATTAMSTGTPPPAPSGTAMVNGEARVGYTAPADWRVLPDEVSLAGVELAHVANVGEYRCGGKSYSRGFAGSGEVPGGEPNRVAAELAKKLGAELYKSAPGVDVSVGTPSPITRGGVSGVQVRATVTTTGDECLGSKGAVSVVLLDGGGDSDALRVVVANVDTAGGPSTPPPPGEAAVQDIADSVAPTG